VPRPSRLLALALLATALSRPGAAAPPGGARQGAAPSRTEGAAPPSPAAPAAAPAAGEDATFEALAAELARSRGDARALALLARLGDLEPALADLARAARAYRAAADDPRAHPEVRALARWRLAGVERARGNLHRAEAELDRMGLVRGWWVAGPFDNEGRRGLDVSWPPETGIDLAARFPGKAREVGWRALPPEVQQGGPVAAGAALRPNREVTIFALAVVPSPRERRVRVWVGTSGAFRLWVNGVRALTGSAYRPLRLDQDAVDVTLRRGPNRLLLEVAHDQGELGFVVRLADPGGRPLELAPAALPPLPPLPPGPDPRPAKVPTLLAALEARARAARGEAEGRARMDLALALAERRADDAGEHRAAREARRAAELLPGDAGAQLLAARLEDEDPNRRREHLEAALRVAPGHPEATVALAEHELRRGRPQEAVRLLEPLAAAGRGGVPARATLAQAWEQAGLPARARLEVARLGADHPDLPAAVEAAARGARRLDRDEEAERWLRKLLALRHDDAVARTTLAQIRIDRGDVEGALALLAEAQRLAPGDVWLRLRRADLLAANGRPEEAEAEYAAAERIAPDEPDVHERRGRARLREGRRADAAADLQRALDLKPQSPQLKELVRQLRPERERFEAPYLLDAAALARAAPPAAGDEDARVLGEVKVTRVYPSGLSATFVQQVVKVYTPRGAEAARTHAVGYVPGRQEVRVERARAWKPDGRAVETHREGDRSTSEPWYRLYYDTRARQVTVPALAPGDVLELAWRTEDVASENLLSDYFGDLTWIADAERKSSFDYVLLVPEGRRIFANEPAVPGLSRTERALPGGVREHRWTVRDVARLEPEPGMPGPGESAPYVHVSTYASWDEVARFFNGLVREQVRPGPEVRAAAERIAADVRARPGAPAGGRELREALVRGVYDFVVTNTRYVGLEFGIHGYKPYRVDQVLARRFGDCKDKASLMHAMLAVLGIDSRLVLLRMRRLGNVPASPASLAVFNHAILWVPELDWWLDGTATGSGSRELPAEDRGATVLVVNPDGSSRFGIVPEARPGENRIASEFRVALAADGSARVTGSTGVSGVQAPEYRRAYQSENERRTALERAMARTFPGLRVESAEVSDPSRIEEDVRVRFALEVPRLARPENGGLVLLPFGQAAAWMETFAPLSRREHDLLPGQPFESRFTLRHALPPGLAPAALPPPERLETPHGAFEVSVRMEGGELVADGLVRLTASRVSAAEYPAFRELFSRVDRALARSVRLERGAPAPSDAGRTPPEAGGGGPAGGGSPGGPPEAAAGEPGAGRTR
jgi:tetratricopeptide (TPR) repeat protein/transglutaminase-like putative cysteine protease